MITHTSEKCAHGLGPFVPPDTCLICEVERLRGLIVGICEAQEEGGDVALKIDEAGRTLTRGRTIETRALRLPDDPQQLLVTTARDAGFSEAQWKAMFYEQGPYDVTFPCFTTKKFIALLLERLQQPSAQKVTRCPHCNDTGWTETPDTYADGSMATSRRCPRGCDPQEQVNAQKAKVMHKCKGCGAEGEPGSPDFCSADCFENYSNTLGKRLGDSFPEKE